MAGDMPGRGHNAHAGDYLRLPVQELEACPVEVRDLVGERVHGCRGRTLETLRDDRHSGEAVVVSRVVEMEVAIRDELDPGRARASCPKRVIEFAANDLVDLVNLGSLTDPGVQQHRTVWMADQERRHDDRGTRDRG